MKYWNLYSRLVVLLIGLFTAAAVEIQPRDPTALDSLLQQAATGDEQYAAARAKLLAAERTDAIDAAVRALNTEGLDGRARLLAYEILRDLKAADTPAGYAELLRGLAEGPPTVTRISCEALPREVVERYILDDLNELHAPVSGEYPGERANVRANRVGRIGAYGPCASFAWKELVRIYSDRDEHERVRWAAAAAMINVGGLPRAVEVFEKINDDTGLRTALWAVTEYVAKNTGYQDTLTQAEREVLPACRSLAIRATRSESTETRRDALESLYLLFGSDYLVGDEKAGFSMNPQLRTALEHMAANDPDPVLAEKARETLNQEALVIKKMLRDRERIRAAEQAAGDKP